MTGPTDLDLVVLVADADQQAVLRSLLSSRRQSLGIRDIRSKVDKHPLHDPGCLDPLPILNSYVTIASCHALVVLDREGCGRESDAASIAESVRSRLQTGGWQNRADAIVIDPELESWVWSPSPHVARTLGWKGTSSELRRQLSAAGIWPDDVLKPPRPKEAMEWVLRQNSIRRVAGLYSTLAEKVSLQGCSDPAFEQVRQRLVEWFPR